jgi:hypothetical protein
MNINTKYDINQKVIAFTPQSWQREVGHIYEIKITRGNWVLYHITFKNDDLFDAWCVEETVTSSE